MKYSPKDEQKLMVELWDPNLANDLYRFVLFAYPWGKKGTPLENHKGPRQWQKRVLDSISAHVKEQERRVDAGLPPEVLKMATASGRGIGKSAMVSWITHWMMTTRIGSTTLISANSEPQLKGTTFAEIKKWFTLSINAHWFELGALSIGVQTWLSSVLASQKKIDPAYYVAQGRLWSEENPHAYAGPHSSVGMLLIFDEASGIPKSIWGVASGYFSDLTPVRLWLAFSNPRANSGGFFDCFHETDKDGKPFWRLNQVDSRTVEGIDHAEFDKQIDQHGIDSDHARVEILGQFPQQGSNQFISNASVLAAQERELEPDPHAPLIMGIDPARYGDDYAVFRWRQGRDGRSIPPVRRKGLDNMALANLAAEWIDKTNPDAVCVDVGNGTGVIDRLRERGYRVHEVAFGGAADDREWANKRTEMYARARDWLGGGCLDNDKVIFGDLTAAEYAAYGKGKDQIMLEPKESFKGRLGRSPDDGDAFVLTFAIRVARRDSRTSRFGSGRSTMASGLDYPLFG